MAATAQQQRPSDVHFVVRIPWWMIAVLIVTACVALLINIFNAYYGAPDTPRLPLAWVLQVTARPGAWEADVLVESTAAGVDLTSGWELHSDRAVGPPIPVVAIETPQPGGDPRVHRLRLIASNAQEGTSYAVTHRSIVVFPRPTAGIDWERR